MSPIPYVARPRVDELDAEIQKLHESMMALPFPQLSKYVEGVPAPGTAYDEAVHRWLVDWSNFRALLWDWSQFGVKWRGWYNSNTGWGDLLGEEKVLEYKSFQDQYNRWYFTYLRLYQEYPTEAKPYEKPPNETGGIQSPLDPLTENLGTIAFAALLIGGAMLLREVRR